MMIARAPYEEVLLALEVGRNEKGWKELNVDTEEGSITLWEPMNLLTWSHEIKVHVIGIHEVVVVHVTSVRHRNDFFLFTEWRDFRPRQERSFLESIMKKLGDDRCRILG